VLITSYLSEILQQFSDGRPPSTYTQLVAHYKDFFANLCVDAVMMLDSHLPLNMIGLKKVQGGSLEVSVVCVCSLCSLP